MLDEGLLKQLKKITTEEQAILDGQADVEKSLYTASDEFVVDSRKMLEKGKLIDIRPHTRFVHFPRHRHNYIEIIYMCTGESTHIINDSTRLTLRQGELLFLNQHAFQEILPSGVDDVAVNFMVLPEFFDTIFPVAEDDSALRDFLFGTLRGAAAGAGYLHFQVADVLPIQNIMENLIWSLMNRQSNKRRINQTTMALLFLQLQNHTDKLNKSDPDQYAQNLMFTALRYIEENYKSATLSELSAQLKQPDYYVSRFIRTFAGQTFKELLQTKRLNQACFLLATTRLSVEDIIAAVGYDNGSYFHRIFKARYQTTPSRYRAEHGGV